MILTSYRHQILRLDIASATVYPSGINDERQFTISFLLYSRYQRNQPSYLSSSYSTHPSSIPYGSFLRRISCQLSRLFQLGVVETTIQWRVVNLYRKSGSTDLIVSAIIELIIQLSFRQINVLSSTETLTVA